MEIKFNLNDVGMKVTWKSLLKGLPSLTPEERAQKARELGREPICRENAAERVFVDGLLNFARGQLVADYATLRARISRVCANAILLTRARLKAAEEKHGISSPEYRGLSQLLAGVEMVVGVIDKVLTGESLVEEPIPARKVRKSKFRKERKK